MAKYLCINFKQTNRTLLFILQVISLLTKIEKKIEQKEIQSFLNYICSALHFTREAVDFF